MSNLALRAISTVVLAPLAVVTAYLGGWPFALFWAAAAIAVLWEWVSLVSGALWIVAGIAYACILWLAPMLLRADQAGGFKALLLLFVIVWTTDVLGYFVGRTIGGPKLCAAISPKKTWWRNGSPRRFLGSGVDWVSDRYVARRPQSRGDRAAGMVSA